MKFPQRWKSDRIGCVGKTPRAGTLDRPLFSTRSVETLTWSFEGWYDLQKMFGLLPLLRNKVKSRCKEEDVWGRGGSPVTPVESLLDTEPVTRLSGTHIVTCLVVLVDVFQSTKKLDVPFLRKGSLETITPQFSYSRPLHSVLSFVPGLRSVTKDPSLEPWLMDSRHLRTFPMNC